MQHTVDFAGTQLTELDAVSGARNELGELN